MGGRGYHSRRLRRWLLRRCTACTASSALRTAGPLGSACRAACRASSALPHASAARTHSWPAADRAPAGWLSAAASATSAAASWPAAMLSKETAAAAHASAAAVRASASAGVAHAPAALGAPAREGGECAGGRAVDCLRTLNPEACCCQTSSYTADMHQYARAHLSHVATLTLSTPSAACSATKAPWAATTSTYASSASRPSGARGAHGRHCGGAAAAGCPRPLTMKACHCETCAYIAATAPYALAHLSTAATLIPSGPSASADNAACAALASSCAKSIHSEKSPPPPPSGARDGGAALGAHGRRCSERQRRSGWSRGLWVPGLALQVRHRDAARSMVHRPA